MALKGIISLVCCSVFAQNQAPADVREWGKQSGSFQLSITSDKARYAMGEMINVTAVLKNVTDEPAMVLRNEPALFYNVDVRVPIPEWIPLKPQAALTPFGEKQKNPQLTHMAGANLKPGGEIVDELQLNKLYVMSTPGEYHVAFSCKLPLKRLGDPWVTSNEMKITVLEKEE
jgi:hypothetical protein